MAVKRRGMNTLVVIFMVIAVSVVGISWFQANISGGSSEQEDLLTQFGVDDVDFRLQNSLLYLQAGFGMAGTNGTWEAGNMSGRRKEPVRYRYWYCQGSEQIPSVRRVRNTTAQFTRQDFTTRMSELHGIRDNHIYRAEDIRCVETGYRTPMDTADNDHFDMAFRIGNVSVATRDGTIARRAENVTRKDRIVYDRFWYMYDVMRQWVQNEDKNDEARTAVSNQVPDSQAKVNTVCLPGEPTTADCEYPTPAYNCEGHCGWVSSAVDDGMRREMRKLEEAEQYFNGSGVECTIIDNKKDGATFPGVDITVLDNRHPPDNTSNRCPGGWDYQCRYSWRLQFTVKMDYTLQCIDTKFDSVPRSDDLTPVRWRIDLSHRFTTTGNGDTYSCDTRLEPVQGCLPASPRSCGVSQPEPQLCQTSIDTTRPLDP